MRLLASIALLLLPAFSQAQPTGQKDWTFLVYLNGHNNLDSFGALNINEMEKVGSTANINIVVQWASESASTTKRLYVQKDNDPNTVTSPVVQEVPKVDMGDYHSLIEFVRWAAANYPAKHYFIDVWDHGNGWHLSQMNLNPFSFSPQDISWDDDSGHFFTTVQLGQALTESAQIIGHKVDVYGSDACLMAMPEVSTEMADAVEFYAGSEETEPGEGWPYDQLLASWDATPNASGADVAKILTQQYVRSYSGGTHGTQEVTFSAFDLSKSGELLSAMTHLSQAVNALNKGEMTKILDSINKSRSFALPDYGDLLDFLSNVESARVSGLPQNALDHVRKATSEFVIANQGTANYNRAFGLSVWLPNDKYTLDAYWNKYLGLKFQQQTHWGEALKAILE